MSSTSSRSGVHSRSNMPTFGAIGNTGRGQASTLLERSNPGIRRSTPDSEALASSDEEVEQSRQRVTSNKIVANRRPSLLADAANDHRKSSTGPGNTQSPVGSQPNTPAVENGTWSSFSSASGGFGNGAAYAFGSSIWASREPPTRLQEMQAEGGEHLPFSIPLQPTPKNYRSQSYSVGQSESALGVQGVPDPSRVRPISNLQRQRSRPGGSLLETGVLRSVHEDEGDEQEINALAQQKEFQKLQLENARLQQVVQHQNRERMLRTRQMRGLLPEQSTEVIEDHDDTVARMRRAREVPVRRMSDIQSLNPNRQQAVPFANTAVGSTRRPHWATDLDFGQLDMIPQSRRHSFADVPTRHGSIGSNDDNETSAYDDGSQNLSQENDRESSLDTVLPRRVASLLNPSQNFLESEYLRYRNLAESYYQTDDVQRLLAEREVQQKLQREQQQSLFGGNNNGIPSNLGSFRGPSTLPLYIVNFKCCRSDVFYIQEGTGLQVQPGELVIVEADRGTDLGTVQHVNITMEEARKYKAYYAEEHYKWLMMFSQQSRTGGPNLVNPNSPAGRQSAVGGMGPQGQGHRDGHNDIKPKLIKRVAQHHEIQALQEKEGNEAKAKRVCQQRVAEHNLNMEILDAEFQMDSKKLTFYYFADEYINFNSLVTDLFKLYKTRIWMSAINPASFQTPTASLGLTPAFGNMGLGVQTSDPRVSYLAGNRQQYDDRREVMRGPQHASNMPTPYYNGYQPTQMAGGIGGFPGPVQNSPDPFAGYNPQSFGMFAPRGAGLSLGRQDSGPRPTTSRNGSSVLSQFHGLTLG